MSGIIVTLVVSLFFFGYSYLDRQTAKVRKYSKIEILEAGAIPYMEYDVEKTLQGQLGYWALDAKGVPVSAHWAKSYLRL